MGRAIWVAGISLMLVLSGLSLAQFGGGAQLAETVSGSGSEDLVLRYPYEGDQARYNSTWQDNLDNDQETTLSLETWTNEALPLPTGETRVLPAQSTEIIEEVEIVLASNTSSSSSAASPAPAVFPGASYDQPALPGELPHNGEPLRHVEDLTALEESSHDSGFDELDWRYAYAYTDFDDGPDAFTYTFGFSYWYTFSDTTYKNTDWINGSQLIQPSSDAICPGTQESLLAGKTAPEAEATIRSCLEESLAEVEEANLTALDSRWSETERFDRAWTLQAAISYETNDTQLTIHQTLVTSPDASLIVERESHIEGMDDGEPVDRVASTTLEEWTPGKTALDIDQDPIGDMPTVPTVAWDEEGPQDGTLSLFPVADAKAAIERTQEGASYFQDAEDPWISQATFVDQDRDTSEFTSLTGYHGMNGVRCEQESSAPSTGLPDELGTRSWDIFWGSEDNGELWGTVGEPRVAHSNPTGEALPLQQATAFHIEDHGSIFEFVPPTQGAAPDALWDHRELAGAYQDRGAYTMSFDGFIIESMDEPPHLDGSVGRVWCQDSEEGDQTQHEMAYVGFDEGTADAVTLMEGHSSQHDDGSSVPSQPASPPSSTLDKAPLSH